MRTSLQKKVVSSLTIPFLTCILEKLYSNLYSEITRLWQLKESKKYDFRMPLLWKLSIVEFYTENTVSLEQHPPTSRGIEVIDGGKRIIVNS